MMDANARDAIYEYVPRQRPVAPATERKFKVGDMVSPCPGAYTGFQKGSRYNLPRETGRVIKSGDGFIVIDFDGTVSPPVNPNNFLLVNGTGPIRTVTRREIVPGRYGPVTVHLSGAVSLTDRHVQDAESLREAAHLFNQFAEVLEENAKEAA